jgi:hypothetical protein
MNKNSTGFLVLFFFIMMLYADDTILMSEPKMISNTN